MSPRRYPVWLILDDTTPIRVMLPEQPVLKNHPVRRIRVRRRYTGPLVLCAHTEGGRFSDDIRSYVSPACLAYLFPHIVKFYGMSKPEGR